MSCKYVQYVVVDDVNFLGVHWIAESLIEIYIVRSTGFSVKSALHWWSPTHSIFLYKKPSENVVR